jgi:hypothetical protein
VNRWYYLEVPKHLRKNVRRKRPQLVLESSSWFFHHDNVPAHALLLIYDFLSNMNTAVLPQPPYSHDLTLADFFLFPKLNSTLKGKRFQTIQEILENLQLELCAIWKKAYQYYFQKGQSHWERCINAGGGSVLKAVRLSQLQACLKGL